MELGSVIFGLLTLACFVVPVIYLKRASKKEKNKFLKNFIQLAEQQQLSISRHDFWNHSFAIGIDINKNKLFYFKKCGDLDQEVLIDLYEVESCRLNNINRNVNQNKVIDRLELVFTFRNPRLAQKTLVFYNKEETISLYEELAIIENWKTIINTHLETIKSKRLPLAS